MKFLIVFNFLFLCVCCKNILLTNDDGFAATNIRSTYRSLKEAGHRVILVAPVSQRSGWSGKFDVPEKKTLSSDGEFDYEKEGEPAWGHDIEDNHIWYFNGTPASSVAFGLRYVIPKHFGNSSNETIDKVDLVVSGPNEGVNLSPGMFTISGTVGAAVAAVYRGIPAIAFSGSNSNNSFFEDSLDNDPLEPSNIYADKVVEFVDVLFKNQEKNKRVLPLGTGLNVNFPNVGYNDEKNNCTSPRWVYTRLTGPYATLPDIKYEPSSDKIKEVVSFYEGLNLCHNGECSLPSENYVLEKSVCKTSVSPFSVDYSTNVRLTDEIHSSLESLVD